MYLSVLLLQSQDSELRVCQRLMSGSAHVMRDLIMVHPSTLQAMAGLHDKGRAHCDAKVSQLRIKMGGKGALEAVVMTDLGGSVKYRGQPNLRLNVCLHVAILFKLCRTGNAWATLLSNLAAWVAHHCA